MDEVKYCFQCAWANHIDEDACTLCAYTEFSHNPELVLPPRDDLDQLTEREIEELRSEDV